MGFYYRNLKRTCNFRARSSNAEPVKLWHAIAVAASKKKNNKRLPTNTLMKMLSKANRREGDGDGTVDGKGNGRRQSKLKTNTHRKRRCSPPLCSLLLLLPLLCQASTSTTATTAANTSSRIDGDTPFSQPLTTMTGLARTDDADTFLPILPIDISPEFISRNVFTKSGQYRVFQPMESESDLRLTVAMKRKDYKRRAEPIEARQSHPRPTERASTTTTSTTETTIEVNAASKAPAVTHQSPPRNESSSELQTELQGLEDLLMEYVQQFFTQGKYEPMPGLVLALQQNHSEALVGKPQRHERSVLEDANVELNIPRALQSARLLFFAGK